MINTTQAKMYCDNYIKIENYELALSDNTQTWDLHHKKEIEENKTSEQLKEKGLYYNRPPDELIFLTHGEHTKLHNIGKVTSEQTKIKISEGNKGKHNFKHTEEARIKISKSHTGENHYLFGKHLSEETRRRMSEANKGRIVWNKGVTMTEEQKKKISEAAKRRWAIRLNKKI